MIALCTYSLEKCGASEILDVVANHEFALIRRSGRWELIGSAGRRRLEDDLDRMRDQSNKELEAMKRLHRISLRSIKGDELIPLLEEIIEAAIFITEADMGNIQLYDPISGTLKIVAHRGFNKEFLDHFNEVHKGQASCGAASQRRERVIVKDVTKDPIFANTNDLPIMLSVGARAVQSTPLFSRSGELLGMISTHYRTTCIPDERDLRLIDLLARQTADIIMHNKAEEEIRRSNNELQQFAYVASHDLQEPLRMVSAYLGLLEKKYGDKLDGDAKQYMDFAIEGGVRARDLIRDLLEYSRVNSQGKEFDITDMNNVIRKVLENLSVRIADENAIVIFNPLPKIVADEVQMTQLMQNLIGNAIKFHGDDSPKVNISYQGKGNEWLFSVRDNGIGIDDAYKDNVFVLFRRLHSQEEYDGTGIGLAIAKKIVEKHGGRIWFDSELGKGTTFFFTMPKRCDP